MKHQIKKLLTGALAIGLSALMLPTPVSAASNTFFNDNTSLITTNRDQEIATFEMGIGYDTWIMDESVVKKTKSTNENIFTVEKREDPNGDYYCLVGHNPGTAYLKTTYTDGSSDVVRVKVHPPIEATKKEVTLKAGSTYYTNLTLWNDTYVIVKSKDSKIATASIPEVNESEFGVTLKIKAKAVGKTTIILKNSLKAWPVEITVNVVKNDPSPTPVNPTGNKRALVIGQRYCCQNLLTSCPKDAKAMEKTLKYTGYSSVTRLTNVSKKNMKKAIANTFKDAKKNDVSLFYYSGHGAENGSLCSYEKDCSINLISPKELASWLSNVPGKVVVILDSCYSGAMINKSNGNVTFEYANYNIINAFKEQDDTTKSDGALCSGKFKVLTACNKKEYSYCNDDYGFFTNSLIKGAGYTFAGEANKTAPADVNKDKMITLDECYKYTSQFAAPGMQTPKCYPSKSGFTIFKR